MAITADHLIVIRRGRLIADASIADFLRSSSPGDVMVRSPRAADLACLLDAEHAVVATEQDGALAVTGMAAATISELAAAHGIPVHELTTRRASLEEAYMQVAESSADYRARQNGRDAK